MAWYFNDAYPWLGMLFCAPIIGLWYWTTDQYIVQRALGAKNEQEARRGTIAAAFLKMLPVFIFIVPGMIAFALAKTGSDAGLTDSCAAVGCPEDNHIDRILFRDSDSVGLTAESWTNEPGFVDGDGNPLSDHPAISVRFRWMPR